MSSSDRTVVEGLHGLATVCASLIDVVNEVVCGLASGDQPTKGYAYTVVSTMSEHAEKLGVTPSIAPETIASWEGET